MGVSSVWAQKITQEELTKFIKILNYIKCWYIIFFGKMSEDSHYIYCLQNESKIFGLRVSISFDLGVSVQFEPKNIIQEKSLKFAKIFNYTKTSSIIFYPKLRRYLHYLYCLHQEECLKLLFITQKLFDLFSIIL